jgi:peptidoglycan DL-endopeptidase LytF
MSRRDTIIVAVLINAGLLIVLFASALKSNSSSVELVVNPVSSIQETPDLAFKKEAALVSGDEVDVALNQFVQNSAALAAPAIQPSPAPSAVSMPSSISTAPNFTDDLKAIAFPNTPASSQTQTPAAQTLIAPIAPQNKPASEFIEVKVKKGDVLEKIARHHHTTVAEIMKANKLTGSNLRIGQVLKIPNKAIKKAEPSTIVYSPQPSMATSSPASENGPKYYTVKKGDNPWTIAVKNHLKVDDLLKLNNMSEEQSRRLKPGDQLRIQ